MSNDARGRILVDRRVQLSLIKRICLHWIAFVSLFFLIVLTIELFLREPGVTLVESAQLAVQKNSLVMILMISILPAFLYDTVKISNRFAGPINRLKNGLSGLANGEEVAELNFRKGDFWGELAEDFNRVNQRLNTTESAKSSSVEAPTNC